MKTYTLRAAKHSAHAFTIWSHKPKRGEKQLPDVYQTSYYKWFEAEYENTIDDAATLKEVLASLPEEDSSAQLIGWNPTDVDGSSWPEFEWPFDLTEEQQETLNSEDEFVLLEQMGYDIQDEEYYISGPVQVLEIVTNKTQGITHTYDHNNKRRYKPFSEEDMVMELLRNDFTPNAIYHRITETLQPYGIKLNKRHATEYCIERKNKNNGNEVDINMDMEGFIRVNIKVKDMVSNNGKSYVKESNVYRATNHTTLSECLRYIQDALGLVQ